MNPEKRPEVHDKHLHAQIVARYESCRMRNLQRQTPKVARHVNPCVALETGMMFTRPIRIQTHNSGTHATLQLQQPTVTTL